MNSIIYIKWKITNRIEIFSNLGKLYMKYKDSEIGVSRFTLNRKKLYDGWENDIVEIKKISINK